MNNLKKSVLQLFSIFNLTNMKTYNVLLICCIICVFAACRKPNYKACFTTSKDTFLVGENIWFYNCSEFDGASTVNANSWYFETDQDTLYVTSGNDSISWVYTTAGIQNVKLKTGGKENADQVIKLIVIIP